MKTIKQLASECGVSRQAIHQRIKREPLSTCLQPYIKTVDNIVYIDVDGEKLIKSTCVQSRPVNVDTSQTPPDVSTQYIECLQDQLGTLLEQNVVLREQVTQLGKSVADLHTELAAMTNRIDALSVALRDVTTRQHSAFTDAVKQLAAARDEGQHQLLIKDKQIAGLTSALEEARATQVAQSFHTEGQAKKNWRLPF